MNKSKSLFLSVCSVAGVAALTLIISPLILPKFVSSEEMSVADAEKITLEALSQKCAACHKHGANAPWVSSIDPVGLIKSDMRNAIRLFDMDEVRNEASIAKLQYAVGNGRMPPARYTVVHFGSTLAAKEVVAINKWIKTLRAERFSNGLAAPQFASEPVQPIPDSLPVDPAKVDLGRILYHDVKLSSDNSVSCATCHDLKKAGTDNLPVSVGVKNQKGGINAPTVFNAVFHFIQFWDGRAEDLQAQAGGPPLNPVEMGYEKEGDWLDIIRKLKEDRELTEKFLKSYPEGYNAQTITHAIAEYEKTLITPNSPFDKYLKGDLTAISTEARQGYYYFKKHGCYTCHVGVAMGGQSFEFADLKGDFFGHRPKTNDDKGRSNFTGSDNDLHKFKVPNLRNIELTWPYMHDASCNTLEEAVDKMFVYLVGSRKVAKSEKKKIIDFLRAQTGQYDGVKLEGVPVPK